MADINITTDFSEVNNLNNALKSTGDLFTKTVDSLVREEARAKRVTKRLADTTQANLDLITKADALVAAKVQQESLKREKTRAREAERAEKEAARLVAANEKVIRAEAKLAQISLRNKVETAFSLGKQRTEEEARAIDELTRAKKVSAQETDRLRMKYDQIYSSSILYEKSLLELNRAHEVGALSNKKHEAALEALNLEYQQFSNAAEGAVLANNRFSQHINQAGLGLNKFGMYAQQVGYQVGDFFVQIQSGTNPMVAFGQQATQLAGLFPGLLGAALGIGISLFTAVASSIMRTTESTKTFKESLSSLEGNISSLNELAGSFTVDNYDKMLEKYGMLNQAVYDNIANIAGLNAQLISIAQINLGSLFSENFGGFLTTNIDEMRIAFETTNDQARVLLLLMDNVAASRGPDQLIQSMTTFRDKLIETAGGIDKLSVKQAEFVLEISRAIDKAIIAKGALKEMAAAAPGSSLMDPAIASTNALIARLNVAVSRAQAIAVFSATGSASTGLPEEPPVLGYRGGVGTVDLSGAGTGSGTGSTGSSGSGAGDSGLEALLTSLQTEREVIDEWYAESQAILQTASETELQIIGGSNEAKLRLEQEYQDKLKGIRDAGSSGALGDAEIFFGGMADIAKAGGDKTVKAMRIFSAAQALINSYVAFTEVLKDPSFIGRPWARFGAAASALSSGLAAVSAIKGGSGGGGGISRGSAAVASPSASSPAPQTVFIDSLDPDGLYSGQALINLFDAFYDENDKRGKVFVVAR